MSFSFGPFSKASFSASPDNPYSTYTGSGGVLAGGAAAVICSNNTSLGNSLVVWLTGATFEAGPQPKQSLSLGGYRSLTEALHCGFLEAQAIPNVNILSTSHQTGVGSVHPVGTSSVAFAADGGATGQSQPLEVGFPVVLQDGSTDAWVKVVQTTSDDLAGLTAVEFTEDFSNVFSGGDDATVSGLSSYRAVMITNQSLNPVTSIRLWVNPLAASSTTTGTLGSSGGATLTGTFSQWPWEGFANVQPYGEVVYYSGRTDTTLTVAIRGCVNTTISAVSNPTLYPVGPIRIGYETPSGDHIQTIVNETTPPSGIIFSTAITSSTGLSLGTLNPYGHMGLWISRVIPSGVNAYPEITNSIGIEFTTGGVTYTDELNGVFRIANSSLEYYGIWIGQDAPPDLTSSPTATFTGSSYSASLAAGHTYYLSTNQQNQYGMWSENTDWTVIVVNGSGHQVNPPPSAPTNPAIVSNGTTFTVTAAYFFAVDGSTPADNFAVFISFDGSAPLDETPILVPVGGDIGGFYYLNWTSGTESVPTTARCVVQMYRSSDGQYSTNTNEVDVTSEETDFGTVNLKGLYRFVKSQENQA